METIKKACKKLLLLFFIAISFSSVAQNCPADFDYTISGDTVVFQNISPNVNINDNFQWNLGDGTTLLLNNVLHLYNSEGIYNVCLTRTNLLAFPPCIDSICKEVVFCVDCVWPGDANRNKISNNVDVLYVGLAYGATGAQRTIDTATNWSPKISSVLWQDINLIDLNFVSGVNYKHADCDGNGVINEDDLLPIDRNYNQTYNKRATPDCLDINDVPLYFEILYDSIEVSSAVQIAIKLGNNARPAIDAYGIAFTLGYDTHLIDSGTITIDYANTGFKINSGDTIIHLNKFFSTDGQIETAVSRTNQNGKIISGETIGIISFVMEDNLAQKRNNLYDYLHLYFTDVYLIASDESRIPVCAFTDSVLVFERILGMGQLSASSLKIYPNPTNNLLNIESKKENIQAVNIYNLTGENVLSSLQHHSNIITLSIENIPTGLYFIEVQTSGGLVVKKLLKD
jgi:hypothetical protein